MRNLGAITGVLAVLMCCGCGGQKHLPSSTASESIRVVEHTQIIPVVATAEIPELSTERQTLDTASHLANKYAESDAVVSQGVLSHSLRTLPQTIEAKTEVVVEYRDSIVYKETVVEKEVPVEKALTLWQKVRIGAFWWLLALALIGWRREIAKLIKLL